MKSEREDEIAKDICLYLKIANDYNYKNTNIGRAYRIMAEQKVKELNSLISMSSLISLCENNG